MRDDGGSGDVARVFVAFVLAADGVAHPVAEVDPCIPEAHARQRGGQEHFRLGFCVVGVFDGAGEVFDCAFEGLEGEDVGDRIGTLVGWAVDGVGGAGDTFGIRDRRPGFEAVAENVKTGGRVNGGGHGAGVERITDAEGGFESPMGDACFGFFRHQIEDGGAGCFAASAG